MKLLHLLLTVLLFNFTTINAQEKILFLGNSMTFYNDMPTLFEKIANAKGKNVEVEQYAPGGTGFVNHVIDENVYNLFASKTWDVVVLQPGTGESGGMSYPTSITVERGLKLIESIRKSSPCAKIILYETSNGVASNNNAGGGNYPNYFATQTVIKNSITQIANGMKIPFAPAGECFRHHYTSSQDLLLHPSLNDVHPNLNGSYLVACSVFNTLYQERIMPCNFHGGIEQTTATYLQNIADEVVLQNKPDWLINVYNLFADFSYQIDGMEIKLQNSSLNFDSITWNINEEHLTSQLSPNYVFSSTGTKKITLTATRNGCTETIIKEVEISPLSIVENKSSKFKIHPNPVNDFLHITSDITSDIMFSIVDYNGKTVSSEQKLSSQAINIDYLSQGVYLVIIKYKDKTEQFRIIKK